MEKFIGKLEKIGFSKNESIVYCNLLRNQCFTATEIAKISNIGRSRVYEILASLVSKGVVFERQGKVRKYEAINPENAFTSIIDSEKKRIEMMSKLKDELIPYFQNKKEDPSPLDFIEVYSTGKTIFNRYEELEYASQEFVYSFCKAPYVMDTDSVYINDAQMESMSRGVKYKSIYEPGERDFRTFIKQMEYDIEMGEEIRIMETLPIKMHIYDEKAVMFSMINKINPEMNLTYMVVQHSDLARTLLGTFEYYWEKAMKFEDYLKKIKKKNKSVS